jgi:hypothetical protein
MERKYSSAERLPILMIVVGRQRVGKTSFLNTTAQFLRAQGAEFQIWDADKMNTTYNMSIFHEDARQPQSLDPEDIKAWLEERFLELVTKRFDAMLDIGGGDTPLARLVQDVPIVATLESEGVRVVLVHVIGPELADLDYLERFAEDELLAPEATLIVMNSGLVLSGRSNKVAFAQILDQPAIAAAVLKGARIVTMPRLTCMSQVTDRGMMFEEAMNGLAKPGGTPLSLFDKVRVRQWWEGELPELFFERIPHLWLPEMRGRAEGETAMAVGEHKRLGRGTKLPAEPSGSFERDTHAAP